MAPMRHSPNGTAGIGADSDYDYRLQKSPASHNDTPPPRPPTSNGKHSNGSPSKGGVDGEEALLDLAQLEELHQEAERMKALGNKHMAAQEYTRAYNAYSAALQLSPVGPSSHVFLSNRAAALLSLKRYSAAATDARRAVALAPTFGKAHARLGQALYFLKDYAGAVTAYEDAIQYEPDNQVTQTYLEKAKSKLAKQQDRAQRYARGEDISIAEFSTQSTVINSIASDPNASAAIVSGEFQQGNTNAALANAIAGKHQRFRSNGTRPLSINTSVDEEDPDFDEAVNIQKRANRFLANKEYKQAIEEYTAALFLVPDDPNLSPQLHLGRSHALNGSRRHASARNDAQLAIKIRPSAEAYSTLAKSLFYLKEYEAAVEAFDNTIKWLPEGESLSQFDQAYLQKASAALAEEGQDSSPRKSPVKSSPVPKLPPPRFVPREQAINSTPNLPPMPKQWPQQSPRSPSALRCGAEREIVFFSESLGIKLNRGPDGIVRVLSVTKETPGSEVARKGSIEAGDVVREAAGVDIRRPITNIMWGDTVALIRLSPRPISLIVAKELSEVPRIVIEQRRLAEMEEQASVSAPQTQMEEMKLQQPSPASGEEAVADSPAAHSEQTAEIVQETMEDECSRSAVETSEVVDEESVQPLENVEPLENVKPLENVGDVKESCDGDSVEKMSVVDGKSESQADIEESVDAKTAEEDAAQPKNDNNSNNDRQDEAASKLADDGGITAPIENPINESDLKRLSLRDEEMKLLRAEILFPRAVSEFTFGGWDNLRWMSHAGVRKVQHCVSVEKMVTSEKKGLNVFGFGPSSGQDYLPRKLVIYEEPSLILLLRSPASPDELRQLLDLPEGATLDPKEHSLSSFLVVDGAFEPMSCKLRLSPLTTPTSVTEDDAEVADPKRRSCFHLLTPMESIAMTVISNGKSGVSYTDSAAFLETTTAELALSKALCLCHSRGGTDVNMNPSWKHQIILGSLHSYVVLGSQKMLEKAIVTAMKRSKDNVTAHGTKAFLHTRIVDRVDDSGLTPLHYACFRHFNVGAALLVNAGARVDIRTTELDMAPVHLCAKNLDHKTLSIILSATYPVKPNPNLVDSIGRTPMYIAAVDGKNSDGERDAASLGRCIMALEAWGGQLLPDPANSPLMWPHSVLAAQWRSEELREILRHSAVRYPLPNNLLKQQSGASIGAFYQYPLHCSLMSLIREIQSFYDGGETSSGPFGNTLDKSVHRTIQTLVDHGFEPNERIDSLNGFCRQATQFEEFLGYSPLQMLACAALEVDNVKDRVDDSVLVRMERVLGDLAELLMQNGARLSLEPPPTKRLLSSKNDSVASSDPDADGPVIDAYDRSSMKLDGNKKLLALLGGNERLNAAKKTWQETAQTPVPRDFVVPFEQDSAFEDKAAPGGSSEKSCAICWSQFGAIMNRKHRCRVSQRYVCDDCSSKRISQDGKEVRISDGQFLFARSEFARAEKESIQIKRAQDEAEINKMKQAHAQARQNRIDEEAQRESLFGGVMGKAANYLAFGDGELDSATAKPAAAAQQVEGITDSLNQTRNALLDRGQKLESLGEKTSQMVDSSAEFARMAKELNRQSGFFW